MQSESGATIVDMASRRGRPRSAAIGRVLLTGATGYVGGLLLERLLAAGLEVRCLARTPERVPVPPRRRDRVQIHQGDLLTPTSLEGVADGCDAAYYLVHSMGVSERRFETLDREAAGNFAAALTGSSVRQIIYLGGLGEDHADLSPHLRSRSEVAAVLAGAGVPVTTLRAAIVIGSGSASFELIRDLAEKLPVMITPRWLRTRCQPIAIADVLDYLTGVLGEPRAFGRAFDIGGPEIVTYRDLLLAYARVRGLRRVIIPVPLLTPRLSSYWIQLVTSVSTPLARALVESLRTEVVCRNDDIAAVVPIHRHGIDAGIAAAIDGYREGVLRTRWTDARDVGAGVAPRVLPTSPPPGGLSDTRTARTRASAHALWRVVTALGGDHGWLAARWAWRVRGWIDQLVGGVGLRRGRRDPHALRVGDAVDFWRVERVEPDRALLLHAEMKVPGDAWLEWRIVDDGARRTLRQTAFFHPKGVLGRAYWFALFPIHVAIFRGMLAAAVAAAERAEADDAEPIRAEVAS